MKKEMIVSNFDVLLMNIKLKSEFDKIDAIRKARAEKKAG